MYDVQHFGCKYKLGVIMVNVVVFCSFCEFCIHWCAIVLICEMLYISQLTIHDSSFERS